MIARVNLHELPDYVEIYHLYDKQGMNENIPKAGRRMKNAVHSDCELIMMVRDPEGLIHCEYLED